MTLSRNSWHVRWFQFVQKNIGNEYRYASGTNLCHYMRVVLLWGPLMVSFWAFIVGLAAFLLLALPYSISGMLGIIILWVFIALWVCTVYGLVKLAPKFVSTVYVKLTEEGSFARVVTTHAYAVKNKFCPSVSFAHPTQENSPTGRAT